VSSPTLAALRRHAQELREGELARAKLSPAGRAAAEAVAREVVEALVLLVAGQLTPERETVLRDLFALEDAA
jgi:hypothetical protein